MKLIFTIFIVLLQVGFAGILKPKYDFIHVETQQYLMAEEFKYHSEINPNFVLYEQQTQMESPPYSNIKIQDMNLRNLTAVNSDGNDIFYKKLYHLDFDNDGFDEMVIPSKGDYKIKFLYLDGSFAKEERRTIFILPSDKKYHNGAININKFKYDNDDDFELVINLSTNYPKKNAYRGLFAVDPETTELLWEHYSAYQFKKPLVYKLDDEKELLIVSASGVSNGLAYSNKNYYKWNRELNQYVQDTTVQNSQYIELLDSNAHDFSIDTNSAVFAIDKNGNKVWEIITGGVFTWNKSFKFGKNILCYTNNRNAKSKTRCTIRLVDPVKGKIIKTKYIDDQNYTNYFIHGDLLFLIYNNNVFKIFNSQLEQIKKYNLPDNFLGFRNSFKFDNKEFFISYKTQDSYIIMNDKFEILKKFSDVSQSRYLPYSNQLMIWKSNDDEVDIYQIVKVHFFKRIDVKTYISISIISSFLLIIILSLWIITMRISRIKILYQKEQLENATSLLVHNEKMSILGTIAGSVAHEINSPLSAIYNSGQRLQKDDRYDENENVNLIITASKRCKDIIEKFLTPVKNISNDKNSNPKKILEDWIDLYGKDFSSHNIKINMKVEDNLNLHISYQELYQILTNILINARDAVVTSSRDNKHIDIVINTDDDFGIIKIKDSGDGFDQQVLDNLFKPLLTTKPDGKGSGIGLWLTKKIIDRNNGEINISSNNDGTLVEIKLLIQE